MSKDEYSRKRIRELFAKLGGLEGVERGMQTRISEKSRINTADMCRILDGDGSKRDLDRIFPIWIVEEPKNTQAEFSELLGYFHKLDSMDRQKYEEEYLHRFPKEAPKQIPPITRIYREYKQIEKILTELGNDWKDSENEDVQALLKGLRIPREKMGKNQKQLKEYIDFLPEEDTDTNKQGE